MSIQTILVPYDFSPSSELALKEACQLGQQLKAMLHLVHVDGSSSDANHSHGRDGLLTVVPPSYEIENKVHREVLSGNVSEELVGYAKRVQADLIVMGSRGRSSIVAFTMGSVAQRVLRAAPCPVILLTAAAQPSEPASTPESDRKYESFKGTDSPALDLLGRAISLRATDIHIDPLETSRYSVRFRIDGRLVPYCEIDLSVAEHLMHQYLILSHLDHFEPFRPREGRLVLPASMKEVEARLTAAPVAGGSSMALRLLAKEQASLPIEMLGFHSSSMTTVHNILHGPEGLVLVTGPTGSGKTTTVYSMLKTFGGTNKNIVSIEDPVEFDVPFVRQMNVDDRHGVTMTSGLKTLLRMDPDIVFLGEIRDSESAEIAMRAASSGRFVFSSLHTRDVASSITCLRDLQVPNQSLSCNLSGVVNQRLLRRLCPHCRQSMSPSEDCQRAFEEQGLAVPSLIFDASGCDRCRGTGFIGRCGVFECVAMNTELLDAIARNATESEMRSLFRAHGATSLLADALTKVADGITSYSEAQSARWM
jgi:general secretion pathway protein E